MRYALLSLALLPLFGSAASAKTIADPVNYDLTPEMSGGTITALTVQVRFRGNPSGTTRFGWSDGWAGERELWQWARDFHVAGATTVEKVENGRWRALAGFDEARARGENNERFGDPRNCQNS